MDVAGWAVTPGFIDMHSHSDWRLFGNRRAESKIRQGVTTEAVGTCGFSPAPVSDEFREDMRGFALYMPPGMDFSWRPVAEYLRRYEDEGVLTLPAAVNRMTGMPASRLGLKDCGIIRKGAKADFVVFSPERVMEPATYEDPHRYAIVIEHVVVNGRTVVKADVHTGNLPDRVLKPVPR